MPTFQITTDSNGIRRFKAVPETDLTNFIDYNFGVISDLLSQSGGGGGGFAVLAGGNVFSDPQQFNGAILVTSINSIGGDPTIEFDAEHGYLKDDGVVSLSWHYQDVTIPGTLSVTSIAGLQSLENAVQAVATIDLSVSNASEDQTIVITDGQGGGQGNVIVLIYKDDTTDNGVEVANWFNLALDEYGQPIASHLLNKINAWSGAVTAAYDVESRVLTLTIDVPGVFNYALGCTLGNTPTTDFTGGQNDGHVLGLTTDLDLNGNKISLAGGGTLGLNVLDGSGQPTNEVRASHVYVDQDGFVKLVGS